MHVEFLLGNSDKCNLGLGGTRGCEESKQLRLRVRLLWTQSRHNTSNQHLSGYTSQTRVATFNPTCVSILQ